MDLSHYESFRSKSVSGRYLSPEHLSLALQNPDRNIQMDQPGESVNGLPVIRLRWGNGPVRVLMWSQMHGNESTTTKAVLDLLNFLCQTAGQKDALEEQLTLEILPMLNPDGARSYTRENASGVDLNRDARVLSQPESRILRSCYESFRPDYCFNLHDQRTIYSLGASPIPATLSFLAPSADSSRSLPVNRIRAMQLIAATAEDLGEILPGGIGRYDDSFNENCVGDQFQMAGTPTLLFEAGHFPGDYEREHTRYFVFNALLSALKRVASSSFDGFLPAQYQALPENGKQLVDIRIRNAGHLSDRYAPDQVLAIQYREVLREGRIHWVPEWPAEGLSEARYGHREWDASRASDRAEILQEPGLKKLLTEG
ncbi:M14 family zinc carboxypeptidase [Robiginitalea sp. SC105]|uniref:M14 family zinc carboxypeptidase n=1 Tax=Robiginitalea sp. SC105 TaxID=2762332 RepID=UPI001639B3D6|nr:M14 family zinc carboxypeptidase [Robiginitalea sp. SC105]MBC2840628.1 peptidase M14 [Robiginitalea sp. SC105]